MLPASAFRDGPPVRLAGRFGLSDLTGLPVARLSRRVGAGFRGSLNSLSQASCATRVPSRNRRITSAACLKQFSARHFEAAQRASPTPSTQSAAGSRDRNSTVSLFKSRPRRT
jgi:hypothetical protein